VVLVKVIVETRCVSFLKVIFLSRPCQNILKIIGGKT
jgi:hypothetical protein